MNNQDKEALYRFPNYLQSNFTAGGFPLDEVLPAMLVFFMLFNIQRLLAVAACIALFISIRMLKVRLGPNFIRLFMYWYGEDNTNKALFKRTPPATKKYWIY